MPEASQNKIAPDLSRIAVEENLQLISIHDPVLSRANVELRIYPLYRNHPTVNGNKWYKLKYNLIKAKEDGYQTLLTFGGAWSNHIYAVAAAARLTGFSSIGVIRGERAPELSSTLRFAEECGMKLHFTDRATYREKRDERFISGLHALFGEFYLIPEGGSNFLGVKGCMEILPAGCDFDYVCCPCGTGATLAGISLSLKKSQQALGFPALKNAAFLSGEVSAFTRMFSPDQNRGFTDPHPQQRVPDAAHPAPNFRILTDYHFGGYAKSTPALGQFKEDFEKRHNLPLDRVYTAKMMFGIFDLARQGFFRPGSRIVVVHTGGIKNDFVFLQSKTTVESRNRI